MHKLELKVVGKHDPDLTVEAMPAHDPEALEIAILNEMLTLIASEIAEVESLFESVATSANIPEQEKILEKYLHACNALSILRRNYLEQKLPHSQKASVVKDTLRTMISQFTSIRFLDYSDYMKEQFSYFRKSIWDTHSKVGINSEGIRVFQYDNSIHKAPDSIVDDIVEICNKLTISTHKKGPQDGFGRALTKNEILSVLEMKNSKLFVLSHLEDVVGFFIVQTSLSEEILSTLETFDTTSSSNNGWLSVVGIEPQSRLALHRKGVNAYELLASMVTQVCYAHNIHKLYAEVRMGDSPNSALKSHLRIGASETHKFSEHNGYTYELLELAPLELPFYLNASLANLNPNKTEIQNTTIPELSKIIKEWDYRDPKTVNEGEVCYLNGSRQDVIDAVNKQKLPEPLFLECSDGIALKFIVNFAHHNMRQLIPNQDIWLCDFYEDGYQTCNFEEALQRLKIEMRPR